MVSQADPGVKPAGLLSTGAKCKWGGKLLTKAGQGLKKDNVAAEAAATRQSWHRFCEVQLPESRFQKLSVPRHWSR